MLLSETSKVVAMIMTEHIRTGMADLALYAAKRQRRNRVGVSHEGNSR